MTAPFRIAFPICLAIGAATLVAAPLRAQESPVATPVVTSSAPQVSAAPAPGPTVEAASAAVKNIAVENRALPARGAGKNFDEGTKLMIVGGAAILTGIVVGGPAGHAISIVGAVVGLYGLYKYLQ